MRTFNSVFSVFLAISMATIMLFTTVDTPATAGAAPGAASYTVANLHVQKYGNQGRPLILIPGLGSGAWVWADTLAALRDKHQIYVLTLAGFDGTPAPEQPEDLMGQTQTALLKLIRSHNIDKPVLIGHSLGGTLAIQFAEQHSDLIGAVIAVDGMPIFPGVERLSAEQRKASATQMQHAISAATAEQFRQQQVGYMQTMGVLDAAAAQKYGALQARSDAATVAQYMAEDLSTDLRPGLDSISVPVLEISPYNEADFKAASATGRMPMMSESQKTDYYRQLLKGVTNLQVVSISPARHFVMLDQPAKFEATVKTFLAGLSTASHK